MFFFLKKHKGRLLLQLFVYIFKCVSSLAESSSGMITTNIEQHV